MKTRARIPASQSGVGMIEVLVTLFVLVVGMLGVAGLSLQGQRASMEALQRNQALVLVQDMVSRINANSAVADCYAITDSTSGRPYAGADSQTLPACSAGTIEAYTQANRDLSEWASLLRGSSSIAPGNKAVGAMIGARGCITMTGPHEYQVTVVWQGMNESGVPRGVACGTNLYGNEALRRSVTIPVQIADLRAA